MIRISVTQPKILYKMANNETTFSRKIQQMPERFIHKYVVMINRRHNLLENYVKSTHLVLDNGGHTINFNEIT